MGGEGALHGKKRKWYKSCQRIRTMSTTTADDALGSRAAGSTTSSINTLSSSSPKWNRSSRARVGFAPSLDSSLSLHSSLVLSHVLWSFLRPSLGHSKAKQPSIEYRSPDDRLLATLDLVVSSLSTPLLPLPTP